MMNYNPLNNAMSYLRGVYSSISQRTGILPNSGLELAVDNGLKPHPGNVPTQGNLTRHIARIVLPFALAGYLLASPACGGQATSPSLPPTNPDVQVVEESQADYSLAEWIPADSSNYSPANRKRGDINQIVIHTTEATTLESTISWFKNPDSDVSAHYLIDSKGRIIQMVREKDIAWHVREYNASSIGIEHVGKTTDPNWATEEMYQASAKLVRHLADKHGIPLDRSHIQGHDELYPKSDPGKHWNWNLFMSRVIGKEEPAAPISIETIVIHALENPYRFEPDKVEMVVGKTYVVEVTNDTGNDHWLVEPSYLHLDILVPAHSVKKVTVTIPDDLLRNVFSFRCRFHEKYDMGGIVYIK